jgi:hypothetical protein
MVHHVGFIDKADLVLSIEGEFAERLFERDTGY